VYTTRQVEGTGQGWIREWGKGEGRGMNRGEKSRPMWTAHPMSEKNKEKGRKATKIKRDNLKIDLFCFALSFSVSPM
jgi:hypothetical protein